MATPGVARVQVSCNTLPTVLIRPLSRKSGTFDVVAFTFSFSVTRRSICVFQLHFALEYRRLQHYYPATIVLLQHKAWSGLVRSIASCACTALPAAAETRIHW